MTSGCPCDQLWWLQRRGRGERGRGVPTGNGRHRRRDVGKPPALQVGCLAVQLRSRHGGLGFTAGTEVLEASTGLMWFRIGSLRFGGWYRRRLWRLLHSSSLFFQRHHPLQRCPHALSPFVFGRCGDPLGEPSVLPPQVLGRTERPGSVAPRLEGYGCRRGPDDGRRVRLWLRMGCRGRRVGGGRQGLLFQLGRGQVAGSESVLTCFSYNRDHCTIQPDHQLENENCY